MIDLISKIYLKASRPRFWIYTLGPILLVLATIGNFRLNNLSLPFSVLALILYFSYPANLLIYGVNDIADRDTDALNSKKGSYEHLLKSSEIKSLLLTIIFSTLPFLFLAFSLPINATISLFLFLFFAIFYSAKPIRAKAIPFIDSIFNILYVFPAISVYYAMGGKDLNYNILIASTLWVMAMHSYSAVPDIKSDKLAGLQTTATVLGKNITLLWCTFLYFASAILASTLLGPILYILFIPYGYLMFLSFKTKNEEDLFSLYKYFPYLNTILGMILFVYIYLQRL